MNFSTDPNRRLALSLLLALLPTVLLLLVLDWVLRPDRQADDETVIQATLVPHEPAPLPHTEKPAEPPETEQPADALPPEPEPVAAKQKPVAATVVVTTDTSRQAQESDSEVPTVDWWQAMDRFLDHSGEPRSDYASLPPSALAPSIANPNDPKFDPNVRWHNGAGEVVRQISEHCRAEYRDAVKNDGFVPPPFVFCKSPPVLALPLREPRYLEKPESTDFQDERISRYAFRSDGEGAGAGLAAGGAK